MCQHHRTLKLLAVISTVTVSTVLYVITEKAQLQTVLAPLRGARHPDQPVAATSSAENTSQGTDWTRPSPLSTSITVPPEQLSSCDTYDVAEHDRNRSGAARRERARDAGLFVVRERLQMGGAVRQELHIRLLTQVIEAGVPGMVLEAGTAKAGTAILLAALKSQSQCLHLYDTFAGAPPPSEKDGKDVHQRFEKVKAGRVPKDYYGRIRNLLGFDQEMMRKAGYPSEAHKIFWHRGLFQDTMWLAGPIMYAHLDGDWYNSVMVPLRRVSARLSVGGVIVFDDCLYFSGARDAMQDYFRLTLADLRAAGERGVASTVEQAGDDGGRGPLCFQVHLDFRVYARLARRGSCA